MIYAALQDEKHKTRFVPWWMHISVIASMSNYEGLFTHYVIGAILSRLKTQGM